MLDHVSIPVRDLEKAARFYDSVLGTLGLERRKQRSAAIGYGPPDRQAPVFWLLPGTNSDSAEAGVGLHISFQARDRSSVDAFFEAGLGCGGRDAGGPGLRPQYTVPFYGTFILDLDGFKIEAVCRSDE